jgi:hypothetical protein
MALFHLVDFVDQFRQRDVGKRSSIVRLNRSALKLRSKHTRIQTLQQN